MPLPLKRIVRSLCVVCLNCLTAHMENEGQNLYFSSLMNPSGSPPVDIPDDSCEQTVLRRLVLSDTITVPEGNQNAQLMFVWLPRTRTNQIFVYVYVGDDGGGSARWAFLKVLNYELALVDYFRLFRVVSGDLEIQSGTVATTLAPLSGFVNAVQTVALPALLQIDTPSQLISSRKTENAFMSQGRLVDGLVMLAHPSGLLDSGFVQPDDPFVPMDWPANQASPFREPAVNNTSYYRTGRFTVEQTEEAVQVMVGVSDPGWATGVVIPVSSLATLWDSAGSVADFPPSVMGEIELDYAFTMAFNADGGGGVVSANVCFSVRVLFYCDRVRPEDWADVDTSPDVAEVITNFNLPDATAGTYSHYPIKGVLRFRPTGIVRRIAVQVLFRTGAALPSVMQLFPYRSTWTSDSQPAVADSRLRFKMVDMTTKGGWNATNAVAIVSGLTTGQVVQVTSRINVAAIPNQANVAILKGRLSMPDPTSIRVARLMFAGSPVFRSVHNVADYRALIALLDKAGALTNATLLQHAFDWGDLLHVFQKVATVAGPIATGVVSAINPAAGAVVGGLTQLLSNARDRSRKSKARDAAPLARDALPLARDARVLANDTRSARPAIAVYAAPRNQRAAGRQLGRIQFFLGVAEDSTTTRVHEWSVRCEMSNEPPREDAPSWVQRVVNQRTITLHFSVAVDLTKIGDLLDVAGALTEFTDFHFVFACSSADKEIAGHSWHAAALNCVLGMPSALWTGSPLVAPGGLVEKLTAAFALGKILHVVGDELLYVEDCYRESTLPVTQNAVALPGEGATVACVYPPSLFEFLHDTQNPMGVRARLFKFLLRSVDQPVAVGQTTLVRLAAPFRASEADSWSFPEVPVKAGLERWRQALRVSSFLACVDQPSARVLSTMLDNLPVRAGLPALQVCSTLIGKLITSFQNRGRATSTDRVPKKKN